MRKNWKVSLIGIVLLIVVLFCACGSTAGAENKHSMKHIRYCGRDIEELKDTETGVHYLIYSETSSYAGMGGICPRYNADGTLYID